MGNVVNLNQVRKKTARAEKRGKADANAVKFGRTKAQKDLERSQNAKQTTQLDAHKRDPE
ncbi:DUF4169 family protein [Actibacterium sp.]|uniref:DUF4169 family protein n=1 Tax=Actibacterium sp. TaxID=1872125 RepID=UPI003563F2EA